MFWLFILGLLCFVLFGAVAANEKQQHPSTRPTFDDELDELDELDEFDEDDEDDEDSDTPHYEPYAKPPYPECEGEQAYYVGLKSIGLSARHGYEKTQMVGMYYRELDICDIGKFEGYAEAQTDNPHDPHAVAIYREDGLHLGFLCRGESLVHALILKQGGRVHCYGYICIRGIGCTTREPIGFYAHVCVEVEPEAVTERNAPYNTTDKFYTYEPGALQKMLEEYQRK